MELESPASQFVVHKAGRIAPGAHRRRRHLSGGSAALAALILLGNPCAGRADEIPSVATKIKQVVSAQPDARQERSWKYIVLHHSATESGSVAGIDAAHKLRLDANGNPWRGIGYHFVIGNGNGMGDGEIQATFRWRDQSDGAHAGVAQFNQLGVGVCLIGDFEQRSPTEAQLVSLQRLINALQQEYGIEEDRILGHRDFRSTACPGGLFPLSSIRGTGDAIQKASGMAE